MKKILTLITLTVLLFTGQAFAEDTQQALSKTELVTQGGESSSCSIPSGVWHDTSWEKDSLWMSVMRVKANGDYFIEHLRLSGRYAELGAEKGAYSCKDDYLFWLEHPDEKIKIKHHTVDKLILAYLKKDGSIGLTETYTSEFKEKKQTFELNPEQMNSYKSFVKYLKAPESQKSCIEELKNSCQNTLEKYINSDDTRANCNKMIDEAPIGVSTSCYIVSKKIKPIFETKGFNLAVTMEMERLGDNANLNHIDTSSVTDMKGLFDYETTFNGDISKWDVSNVTDMSDMFMMAYSFKGDISKWDVSNVTDMSNMFKSTSFNGDISKWDVSNVEKMDNIGNDDLKKLIIAQRQAKELKEECKKIKPISTGDICTGVLGLVAVNFKDEFENKQTPDPQKLTQLFELSEYTFGQFASCSKREPTIEQVKVMTCQLINGDLDHLLLKNLNNKRGAKKVINLSIKQCIDQGMDIANKTRAKYGSNPTAEQALDVSIESGVSLSEMMHCKKLSEEKPWEYAQEAAKRF